MTKKKRKNNLAKGLRKTLGINFITSAKIADVFKKEGFPSLMDDKMADNILAILSGLNINAKKICVMDVWEDDTLVFPEIMVGDCRVTPDNDLPLWDGRV